MKVFTRVFLFSVGISGLFLFAYSPLLAQTDADTMYTPPPEDGDFMKAVSAATPEADDAADLKVHELPFASKGNLLELEVVNTTGQTLSELHLDIQQIPGWLTIQNQSTSMPDLEPDETALVLINFDVNESAPTGQTGYLKINVSSTDGTVWDKTTAFQVSAPEEFQLSQNYPNPFNPSTTIRYQLPEQMTVRVSVFDLSGRRIAELVNENQTAGGHTVQWNASPYASGIYFYRVTAQGTKGSQIVQTKKMVLVK